MRRLSIIATVLVATAAGQAGATSRTNGATANAETAAPAVVRTGWVTDAANILTPIQRVDLSIKLDEFEKATRHEMVVVTVRSLGGRDVAPFTRELGSKWGVGHKNNDGMVLLVAPQEQMVWIAVGKGLESMLTREACQKILDETMMPRFRGGDLPGGIDAGTDALIAILR